MEEVVIRRKSKPFQMDDGNTPFIKPFINGLYVVLLTLIYFKEQSVCIYLITNKTY